MSEQKGFTPEVTVVRRYISNSDVWMGDDSRCPDNERAYLVRGLPMPGEKVKTSIGDVYTVTGLEQGSDGLLLYCKDAETVLINWHSLRPYDPEAEEVERVAKALFRESWPACTWLREGEDTKDRFRREARIAIAALREGSDD
jgi:hypothetical protein